EQPSQAARLGDGKTAGLGARAARDVGDAAGFREAEPRGGETAVQLPHVAGIHPSEQEILFRRHANRTVAVCARQLAEAAHLLAGRWIDLEGRHLSPQPAGRELAIVLLAKARPAELPDHELHAIALLVLVVPEALKDLQHGFGNPEDF